MERKLWSEGGTQIMGATNEIKGTNISLQLAGKKCSQCQQPFTQEEINNENYDLWFDTTNDVGFKPISEVESNNLYFPSGSTGYQLTIWIRSIEHEDCPETELCEQCDGRFLAGTLLEIKEGFYCEPCAKEVNHE